jgi:galactokinase
LLGEHVDYNDGFVMPAAIDRATYLVFSAAEGNESTILADDLHQELTIGGQSVKKKTQVNGQLIPDWGLYPAGVYSLLEEYGFSVSALKGVFASDVPIGAGLSSSASVEVAFLNAWLKLGNISLPQMEQARLCQQAENDYVGVNCGIMDQFASVCGETDRLLYLDCRSMEWETLPLPKDVTIVIADTRVRRKLTSGEYNQRRQDCEEAVRILQADLPGITALREVNPVQFNALSNKLSPGVERHARHVVEEIARTGKARTALDRGDISEFGSLMNDCHRSLRDLFEVSCIELDRMVEIAQSLDGCYGSRLTGAGFGGCTVSLVEKSKAEAFCDALGNGYYLKTKIKPEIYQTNASQGVMVELVI